MSRDNWLARLAAGLFAVVIAGIGSGCAGEEAIMRGGDRVAETEAARPIDADSGGVETATFALG